MTIKVKVAKTLKPQNSASVVDPFKSIKPNSSNQNNQLFTRGPVEPRFPVAKRQSALKLFKIKQNGRLPPIYNIS